MKILFVSVNFLQLASTLLLIENYDRSYLEQHTCLSKHHLKTVLILTQKTPASMLSPTSIPVYIKLPIPNTNKYWYCQLSLNLRYRSYKLCLSWDRNFHTEHQAGAIPSNLIFWATLKKLCKDKHQKSKERFFRKKIWGIISYDQFDCSMQIYTMAALMVAV